LWDAPFLTNGTCVELTNNFILKHVSTFDLTFSFIFAVVTSI
jgi:hypothetical protein